MARPTRLPGADDVGVALRRLHSPTLRPGALRPFNRQRRPLSRRIARELRRLPVFATSTRRDIRFLARWGDLLEVDEGHELVRQGHSDWWLLTVVAGRLTLTHDGHPAGELTAGDHFGEDAVVGLRPQQLTATASERSVLFVLGPRYVLSLLASSAHFRSAVLPGVAASDYRPYVRRMYETGQAEWHALAVAGKARPEDERPQPKTAPTSFLDLAIPTAARPGNDRMRGRPLSLAEAADAFAHLPPPPAATSVRRLPVVSRRTMVVGGAVATAALGAVLFLYHPPRLVLSAGQPIDVASDIQVTGATTYPSSGHYLMLWVHTSHPTLAGYLAAWVRGRDTVPMASGDGQLAVGRAQYLDSQRIAIRLALKRAGLDPSRVSVHIRDRGFVGPSAGLVYALALEDELTQGDLSRGRVVGVSGALLPDGSVEPIGFLFLKAGAAVDAHAALLVVPAEEAVQATGWPAETCGVVTFADALRALADTNNDARCVPPATP